MMLTPVQLAEIRERLRCDAAEGSEQTASDEYCAKCGEPVDVRHGCEWTGGFSWCDSCSQEFAEAARTDIPALLAALDAAASLAKEIENHCPCGARPESPRTHPHVTGCPVYKLLRVLGVPRP